MRISHGVGAALRDAREERLRRKRPVEGRVRVEAGTGDATHPLLSSVGRPPETTHSPFAVDDAASS